MSRVRIYGLTDHVIIDSLAPGARSYNYTVTVDEFDEFDDEGPGDYFGVEVSANVARRWNAGIAACKAAGVSTRSREGLALRHEAMHGTRTLPPQLERWIEAREEEARAEAEREAQRQAEIRAYEALMDGLTDVGDDEYTAQFWPLPTRAQLERLGEIDRPHRRIALRLPNGDVMEVIEGVSFRRWTSDPDVAADHVDRSTITGHRYDPELLRQLADLERAGDLWDGMVSWFGGIFGLDEIEATGVQRAYGIGAKTGPEKVSRLRSYLERLAGRFPGRAERIQPVLDMVRDDSIVEIREGGAL